MDFGQSRVKETKYKNKLGTMDKLGHWRETRRIDGMSLVDKKLGARAGSKGPCKARLIVGISLVKIIRDNRLIDGISLAG